MRRITDLLTALRSDERAQDGFEYVLAITLGAMLLAGLIAAFAVLVPEVVGLACGSVDTEGVSAFKACLGG